MWPVINSSAVIGWNILSSLNAVILANEGIKFIAGHMVYNPAYNYILQTIETYVRQLFSWKRKFNFQFRQPTECSQN